MLQFDAFENWYRDFVGLGLFRSGNIRYTKKSTQLRDRTQIASDNFAVPFNMRLSAVLTTRMHKCKNSWKMWFEKVSSRAHPDD